MAELTVARQRRTNNGAAPKAPAPWDYAAAVREKLAIGSGVTGTACKTIVKARLSGGDMRWHLGFMQQALCLRALRRSSNRWDQFWKRIDRHSF